MYHSSLLLLHSLSYLGSSVNASPTSNGKQVPAVKVSHTTPDIVGIPLESFVSYSIEFAFFPDFAGNISSPNTFSKNLLDNLGDFAGSNPIIRVGGNTQDYAIFNSSLKTATVGIYNYSISADYPTTVTIGPAFFESYHTWPNTQFVHGFNLASNSSQDRKALLDSVPYACKALSNGRLLNWELGNEPDLYKTSAQGAKWPATWDEQDFVNEWLHWTKAIQKAMQKACPTQASKVNYKYYAPSFAGNGNSLSAIPTWQDGLDADGDIAIISQHNYISGATTPGVTLQHTLMNHTSNIVAVKALVDESQGIAALSKKLDPGLPFILGETNSLYNEGRPGLSNTFGAALWGVDFNLMCATYNVSRVHMHQGLSYRYQAWQPRATANATKGTKAPYYGSIAVAAFLGDLTKAIPSIANIPLPQDEESAYAAYVDGKLDRLIVINMMEYNATAGNPYIDHYKRPNQLYSFQLPAAYAGKASVHWLMANGSDAITGITYDGNSYNYELNNGKPLRLHNVTIGQTTQVSKSGLLKLEVPRSSAAIVKFSAGW